MLFKPLCCATLSKVLRGTRNHATDANYRSMLLYTKEQTMFLEFVVQFNYGKHGHCNDFIFIETFVNRNAIILKASDKPVQLCNLIIK